MGHMLEPNVFSSKLMAPAEAAYVAGVIDGEGTIGVRANGRREGVRLRLTPCLRVANTNLDMLHVLVQFTGNGGIVQKNLSRRAHRLCYEWVLSANQIRHVLPQVMPYLFGKQRQALLVSRYLSLVRGHQGVADEHMEEARIIREELAALNLRGGSEAEHAATIAEFGRQACSVDGCDQRRYRGHTVCYQHWLTTREVNTGHCARCGSEMTIADVRKRFCSQRCQLAHWHETVKKPALEAQAASRPPAICPACGKEVDRRGSSRKVFCDAHCQAVHRARQKKRPADYALEKTCAQCGAAFQTKFGKQKYCSDACNKAAYRERMKPE